MRIYTDAPSLSSHYTFPAAFLIHLIFKYKLPLVKPYCDQPANFGCCFWAIPSTAGCCYNTLHYDMILHAALQWRKNIPPVIQNLFSKRNLVLRQNINSQKRTDTSSSQVRYELSIGIGIHMLKIRRSHDRLFFNMGIPIPLSIVRNFAENWPCYNSIPLNPEHIPSSVCDTRTLRALRELAVALNDLLHIVLGAHEDRDALVDLLRLEIQDGLSARGRQATSLLNDEGHGVALVQQTQLK